MRIEIFTSGIFKANSYVVGPETGRDALVIDPGGNVRPILAFIRGENLRVVGILNTHADADHCTGNAALKRATGAPILIHEADADRLTRFSFLAIAHGRLTLSPPADRRLADGDTVAVGPYDFEIIHTPGHTPGGICLKYKKALFTGDTLMAGSIGNTDRGRASWEKLAESILERLFVLSDDVQVYPGHGPRTNIGRERHANIFVRHHPDKIEKWLLDAMSRELKESTEK
ncbi:MBL fold metallo-hydrolase [bacterium]|nr:MBL fold metallo-hydrolase [bacterium]